MNKRLWPLLLGAGLVLWTLAGCGAKNPQSNLVPAPPNAEARFWTNCHEVIDAKAIQPNEQTFECGDVEGGRWRVHFVKLK